MSFDDTQLKRVHNGDTPSRMATSRTRLISDNSSQRSPNTSTDHNSDSDSESDSSEVSVQTGSTHHQQLQSQQQRRTKSRGGTSSRPLGEIHESSEPVLTRQLPFPDMRRPSHQNNNNCQSQFIHSSKSAPNFEMNHLPHPGVPETGAVAFPASGVMPSTGHDRRRHYRSQPHSSYPRDDTLYERFRRRFRPVYDSFIDCRIHHRCLWLWTVAATLISILTCGFVITTTYLGKHLPGSDTAPDWQRVCLPCEDWNHTPLYTPEGPRLHTVYHEHNSKVCCAQMSDIVKSWIITTRTDNLGKQSFHAPPGSYHRASAWGEEKDVGKSEEKSLQPFAHVPIVATDSAKTSDNTFHLSLDKYFNHNAQHGRNHYGVTVTDTSLVIDRTGVYYVYSEIYLEPGKKCTKLSTNTMSHYVKVKAVGSHDRTLLKSVHTCHPNSTSEMESKFVAGVFCLRKNAEVYAEIEYPDILEAKEHSTSYLGVLMTHSEEVDCSIVS